MHSRGIAAALGLLLLVLVAPAHAQLRALAAGHFHTCALTTTGQVQCWGRNDVGQLGDGTTVVRHAPTPVAGLGNVQAIASFYDHTCALTAAGAVKCWGANGNGQLGDGTTVNRSTPVQVAGLESGVVAIATGGFHSCALTGAGAVKCWGANGNGQLGDGTAQRRLTPVTVSGLASGIASIAAGSGHSCAVTTQGALLCWGFNAYGQLGDGTVTSRPVPAGVTGLSAGVHSATAGDTTTCALSTSGAVQCWGRNDVGAVGDATTTSPRRTPVPVTGLASGQALVDGGGNQNCAVSELMVETDGPGSGGTLRCWGLNTAGQLGDGSLVNRTSPVVVSGMEGGVFDVAAGFNHTCALVGSAARCWGDNHFGQLGDGTLEQRTVPVTVLPLAPSGNARADFNADGISDVAWRNTGTGADAVWRSANAASAMAVTAVTNLAWKIAGVGDFDGDGRADLFWRNAATGANVVWKSASSSTQMAVEAVADTHWIVAGTGDFDADGRADVLWRNTATGANVAWKSADKATPLAVAGVANLAWRVAGIGDFNGDGRSDIFWRNTDTGANVIWRSANATTQQPVTGVSGQAWIVGATGDFDGDGADDVFWRNTSTGTNAIWRTGSASVPLAVASAPSPWRVAAAGDYDGDGRDDILWRNGTTGANVIWKAGNASTPQAVATVAEQAWTIVP